MKRGLELCPELVPEEIRSQRAPTLEDLKPLIIEECCGLRPARVGGIRLESVHMPNRHGKDIPVIFNYGSVSPSFGICSPNDNPLMQAWRLWLSELVGLRKHCSGPACCIIERSFHGGEVKGCWHIIVYLAPMCIQITSYRGYLLLNIVSRTN